MTYPIRLVPDGDTAWGSEFRATTAGVNDHQTRVSALEVVANTVRTADYTLALADANTAVEANSTSGVTITVPPNSSVAFPVGTVLEIARLNTGSVTVAAGAGVTLRTASSLSLRSQYSVASLRKRATNEWLVTGDLT